MLQSLVFYDLKREVPNKAEWPWSPYTWQTRLALNIKGIPYKTEWLDFIEVGPKMQELGLKEKTDEPLKYTVPTVYDPNTKRVVNDSQAIAEYLEEQYPDTVKLIPPGTHALQAAFVASVQLLLPIFPIVVNGVGTTVAEHDREYFWESRKALFGGKSIEEVLPVGEALSDAVRAFEKALEDLAIHVDLVIVAYLTFVIRVLPEDHPIREVLKSTKGGRWTRYLEGFSEWIRVD